MCVIETTTAGREYKVRDMAQADFGCVSRVDGDSRSRSRCRPDRASAGGGERSARAIGRRRDRGNARVVGESVRGKLFTRTRGRAGGGARA